MKRPGQSRQRPGFVSQPNRLRRRRGQNRLYQVADAFDGVTDQMGAAIIEIFRLQFDVLIPVGRPDREDNLLSEANAVETMSICSNSNCSASAESRGSRRQMRTQRSEIESSSRSFQIFVLSRGSTRGPSSRT